MTTIETKSSRARALGSRIGGLLAALGAFVALLALAAPARALTVEVITVPAQGVDPNIPHWAYNGHPILLKAIARVYNPGASGNGSINAVRYRWDTNSDGRLDSADLTRESSTRYENELVGGVTFYNLAETISFEPIVGEQPTSKLVPVEVLAVKLGSTWYYPPGSGATPEWPRSANDLGDRVTATYRCLIDPTVPMDNMAATHVKKYDGQPQDQWTPIPESLRKTSGTTDGALHLDDILRGSGSENDKKEARRKLDIMRQLTIEDMLWHLHVYMGDSRGGRGKAITGWYHAGTAQGGPRHYYKYEPGYNGAVAWAFEIQGHLAALPSKELSGSKLVALNLGSDVYPGGSAEANQKRWDFNPYAETVLRCLNYIANSFVVENGSADDNYVEDDTKSAYYGGLAPRVPGTKDGWGYRAGANDHQTYQAGLSAGAIALSGFDDVRVYTGDVWSNRGGKTWRWAAQQLADYIQFSQSDCLGSWYYTATDSCDGIIGDSSTSQWGYIGMEALEFGMNIPISKETKRRMAYYIVNSRKTSSGWGYPRGGSDERGSVVSGGEGYGSPYRWHPDYSAYNLQLTGGAITGCVYLGANALNGASGTFLGGSPRDGKFNVSNQTLYNIYAGYLRFTSDVHHWEYYDYRAGGVGIFSLGDGWSMDRYRTSTSWGIYAMYSLQKAAQTHKPQKLSIYGRHDWFREFVVLGVRTRGLTDGNNGRYFTDSWIFDTNLATAMMILTMTTEVFEPPPQAINVSPNPSGDCPWRVDFSGEQSFHPDPRRKIQTYSWDFGDGFTHAETGSFDSSGNLVSFSIKQVKNGVTYTWNQGDAPNPLIEELVDATSGQTVYAFDGKTSHRYQTKGTYTVKMSVTDDNIPEKRKTVDAGVLTVSVAIANSRPAAEADPVAAASTDEGTDPAASKVTRPFGRTSGYWVKAGGSLLLDARATTDADIGCGDSLTYEWDLAYAGDAAGTGFVADFTGQTVVVPWDNSANTNDLVGKLGTSQPFGETSPKARLALRVRDAQNAANSTAIDITSLVVYADALTPVLAVNGSTTTFSARPLAEATFDIAASSQTSPFKEVKKGATVYRIDTDGNGSLDLTLTTDASGHAAARPWGRIGSYDVEAEVFVGYLGQSGTTASSKVTRTVAVTIESLPPVVSAGGPYRKLLADAEVVIAASARDPDIPVGDALASWKLGIDQDQDGAIDLVAPGGAARLLAQGTFASQPADGTSSVPVTIPVSQEALEAAGAGAVGDYKLVFIATDAHGKSSFAHAALTVYVSRVNAEAQALDPASGTFVSGPVEVACGSTATFRHSESNQADTTRTLVQFAYAWGDGTEGYSTDDEEASVGHAYARAGTYFVTLTVTDDEGRTGIDRLEVRVVIDDDPPTIITTQGASVYEGEGASFTARVDDADVGCGDTFAGEWWALAGDPPQRVSLGTWTPFQPAVAFGAGTAHGAGSGVTAPRVVDLDGDGRPDVLHTRPAEDAVAVLWNDGGGAFSEATVNLAAGADPRAVAAADFTGDGLRDLVVAERGHDRVTLLENAGGRSFISRGVSASLAGGGGGAADPVSIATGDWNGDGKADIAVASSASNSVDVVLGAGDGTLGAAKEIAASTDGIRGVEAADFDGDGRDDIAYAVGGYANGGSGITVLFGDAAGDFARREHHDGGYTTVGLGVADFNGDGRPDAASAALLGASFTVYLNDGSGTLHPRTYATGQAAYSMAVGDLDADGNADVVVSGDQTYVAPRVYTGDGHGGFDLLRYATFALPMNQAEAAPNAAFADLDGDLRPDAIGAQRGYDGGGISIRMSASQPAAPPIPPLTATLALSWGEIEAKGLGGVGTHSIAFTATDSQARSTTATTTLEVKANRPSVALSADHVESRTNIPIRFTATGGHTRGDSKLVSWRFLFGDGAEETVATPAGATKVEVEHAYAQTRSVTARVVATDDQSQTAEATLAIRIATESNAPVAKPGGPYELLEGEPLPLADGGSFDPDAAFGDTISKHEWYLEGVKVAEGATPSVPWADVAAALTAGVHYPANPETRNPNASLELRVTDSATPPRTHSATTQVVIYGTGPVAALEAEGPTELNENQSLVLSGAGSYHANPAKSIFSYTFDFGDGTTYVETRDSAPDGAFDGRTSKSWSGSNVVDGQLAPYTVRLTVADDSPTPSTDEATLLVSVKPPNNKPAVRFASAPYRVQVGQAGDVVLDGTLSTDADAQHPTLANTIVRYRWDLDPAANDGFEHVQVVGVDANAGVLSLSWAQFAAETGFAGGAAQPTDPRTLKPTYPVLLEVTDDYSLKVPSEPDGSGTGTAQVQVFARGIAASLAAAPAEDRPSSTVTLDARGSYPLDPRRRIVSYTFDFGDGSEPYTESEGTPAGDGAFDGVTRHVYTISGTPDRTFAPVVTLRDERPLEPNVESATASVRIWLENHEPTVDAGGPYVASTDEGAVVALRGTASDADVAFGDALEVEWHLDADDVPEATTLDATFTVESLTAAHGFTPGTPRTVRLTARDRFGGSRTDTAEVGVHEDRPLAVAAVATTGTLVCGHPVAFSHAGSRHLYPSRKILSYAWDFDGDGTVDRETSERDEQPLWVYPGAGTYQATLTVTDDNGASRQDSDTVAVTIAPSNLAVPVVEAGADQTINTEHGLTLLATASDTDTGCGDRLTRIEWDLTTDGKADVTIDLAADPGASRTTALDWTQLVAAGVKGPGTFVVTLKAYDTGATPGTDSFTLRVYRDAVVVDLVATPSTALCGDPVGLSAAARQDDPRRKVVSFEWDLDYDGATFDVDRAFTPAVPANAVTDATSRAYGSIGPRRVAVRVQDDQGKVTLATADIEVTVQNLDPIANAGADVTFFIGPDMTATLDGSHSRDDNEACGDELTYTWTVKGRTYSGETVALAAEDLAELGFARPGTEGEPIACGTTTTFGEDVALTVTDSFGRSSTDEMHLTGKVDEPIACATVLASTLNTSCGDPKVATFRASQSSHGAGRAITTYAWDFLFSTRAEGVFEPMVETSTSTDVTFGGFPRPGFYTARLQVTDENGKEAHADVEVEVVVTNNAPIAAASRQTDGGRYFYEIGAGGILTLDGGASSDADQCFGDTVTLYEWDMNNDGDFDDLAPGQPDPLPAADTLVETPSGGVVYDVRTTYATFRYRNLGWKFGLDQGIKLRVRDSGVPAPRKTSAPAEATIRILPNAAPVAFSGNDQTVEFTGPATSVTLDGTDSSDGDRDPLTYKWSLVSTSPANLPAPAGLGASSATPSVSFSAPGAYTIQLIVNDGKVDSVADVVTITLLDRIAPALSIVAPADGARFETASASGTTIQFSASASDGGTGVASFTWRNDTGKTVGTGPVIGSAASFSLSLGQGTFLVSCRVADGAGNQSAFATSTFTISDTTKPTLDSVPATITRVTRATAGEPISYAAQATDNLPGVQVVVVSAQRTPFGGAGAVAVPGVAATGGTFPEGDTVVTLKAVDASQNESAPKSFLVRVLPDYDADDAIDFRAGLRDLESGAALHDLDGDGVRAAREPGDNAIDAFNPDQADSDLDGVGDVLDPSPIPTACGSCAKQVSVVDIAAAATVQVPADAGGAYRPALKLEVPAGALPPAPNGADHATISIQRQEAAGGGRTIGVDLVLLSETAGEAPLEVAAYTIEVFGEDSTIFAAGPKPAVTITFASSAFIDPGTLVLRAAVPGTTVPARYVTVTLDSATVSGGPGAGGYEYTVRAVVPSF